MVEAVICIAFAQLPPSTLETILSNFIYLSIDWWDEDNNCVYELTETSMIDHILLSQGLYSKMTNFYIAHDLYTETCDTYYSDHFAVVVVSTVLRSSRLCSSMWWDV